MTAPSGGDAVTVERSGPVTTVPLFRPQVRNASASPSVVANRPAVFVPSAIFMAPVRVARSTRTVAPSSSRA